MRKIEPRRLAATPKVTALHVNPGHEPWRFSFFRRRQRRPAQQRFGVMAHGVTMIGIHMGDYGGFALPQVTAFPAIEQTIARDPDRTPESGHQTPT